jgi:hypothetical protein
MTTRINVSDGRELQGLIAFKILEYFFEKGESLQKKDLHKGLANIYHGVGPGDPVSYASLAFDGQKPFTQLYNIVEGTVGNERHILSSLTRDPSTNVVAGKSFTAEMLKQSTLSSPRPIAGLSLWNRAEQILKNCKKAAAFAKEKLKPDGSFNSGTNNADDFWEHVLDKMYEYLKSEGEVGEVDDENEDDSVAPGVRPSGWYFRGFWTFQLFGPLAPLEEQCSLFNLASLDALAVGRKAIHASNAKNKRAAAAPNAPVVSIDGNAVTSPSGFKRGIGIKEKTAIVHLAQQQMMATTRDDELEFETMSKTIDVLKDELNFALAIVRELQIMDKEDDAWKNVFELQKRLAERNVELREYQIRKRQKREEEKRNGSIFDTFISSVNRNYQVPVPPSVTVPSTTSMESSVSTDDVTNME